MLKSIYNQKITILNKLKRTDGLTGVDVWHKYVIEDAAWYTDSARSASSSAVFIGTYITVLIPFHEEYLPYREWKKAGNQEGHYTISQGDYVILGDVPETITAQNLVETIKTYGEDACLVRHHKAAYDRFGARVQLKIEGV